ncbi:hypothetical protein ACFO4L_15050 [Bacillus daqingensis]|uniref:Cellobiose phosphorylase n=1 Tax=Bacillus daqingensis TaxID=872396 RepID=A0ABV9P019_9BACI
MYKLNDDHSFSIMDYQKKAPFSSFLPGLAGEEGIPIWAFYVNRGQGIVSFGTQDKNNAVLEFMPADKAYRDVYTHGFRTFINLVEGDKRTFLEPFSAYPAEHEQMEVAQNGLKLQSKGNDVEVEVDYFVLPESASGALVRRLQLRNVSGRSLQIEAADGMPAVLPSGVDHVPYKELGNTLKSWFDVLYTESGTPFYQLRGSTADSSEVSSVEAGNYYWSLVCRGNEEELGSKLTERSRLFGTDTSLQFPQHFVSGSVFTKLGDAQQTTNQVSSGFTLVSGELADGEAWEVWSVSGCADSIELLEKTEKHWDRTFLQQCSERAEAIAEEVTAPAAAATGEKTVDAYTRQCYLDNGLRGGFPHVFESEAQRHVYYLFSRKHGDLERDYNFFSISPTFYSQGNGNYRDINQNRRMDVFFEPEVRDANIHQFMSLTQLDGYNPLHVKGVLFHLPKGADVLKRFADSRQAAKLLQDGFTPGSVKHLLESGKLSSSESFSELLGYMLDEAEVSYEADYGEGYWTDHWTYNLDLIDAFLSVYPDKQHDLFFGRSYPFFRSPAVVVPRSEKYVMTANGLRQYKAVRVDKDRTGKWEQTTDGGRYETNLYGKLLLLAATKAANLAPYGYGLEMEADKPGWNDSLNGLPGMIGSCTAELFELKRLFYLLRKADGEASLPEEAVRFIDGLCKDAIAFSLDSIALWHAFHARKEAYRQSILDGVSGAEKRLAAAEWNKKLEPLQQLIDEAAEKVNEPELPATYYYFEADISSLPEDLTELDVTPRAVAPYLEGIVKSMKMRDSQADQKKLYDAVKRSGLYDQKLGMYKVSGPIGAEPAEIGRAKAFTPGWLENESVFLHMEYKYMLEVLRSGMHDAFFDDVSTVWIPFLDPDVYGRSTLENSSFIASSANPDPALHGRGFVSRLSGATVEYLHMWIHMMTGPAPFRMQDGELRLQLEPVLPSWMFTEDGTASFTLFGSCSVTYHNSSGNATFGEGSVQPEAYIVTYRDGKSKTITGRSLGQQEAEAVRSKDITSVDVYLKPPVNTEAQSASSVNHSS